MLFMHALKLLFNCKLHTRTHARARVCVCKNIKYSSASPYDKHNKVLFVSTLLVGRTSVSKDAMAWVFPVCVYPTLCCK